ncbi:MAG: IPT/TIG domain-containing protein [Chloroflexi bacterium]|nr:IPT/TIG domain-containing protein [Chloroflexota bacterium]
MTRYRRLFYVMIALSLYTLAWWAGKGASAPAALAASRQQTIPPPALLSVLPNSGYNSSPTAVQIRGSGFISTPTVLLGNTPLLDVTFVSSTTLSATVPAGLTAGVYSLTVKNPDQQQTTQANAFTVKQATVQVASVSPAYGFAGQPAEILLSGVNFAPGAVARLGNGTAEAALATAFLSSFLLRAAVPANLPPDSYAVSVYNPDGNGGQLAAAYTLLAPVNDDLRSDGYALWSAPRAVRRGSTALLGLVVERQGGKNPLLNVAVDFYAGNPSAGGGKIGAGIIPLLSPRSSASTSSVEWAASAAQTYTLYAVIDPLNKVAESLEGNNVVSRTVAVLEMAADQQPPQLELFALADGSNSTDEPTIALRLEAEDPLPGQGIGSFYLREFVYSQGTERWLLLQESGWLPTATPQAVLGWSLFPLPGIHTLQAWAADVVGNVSAPLRLGVNYVVSPDAVQQDQVRLYRYTLKPNQQLHVRVQPSSGDADLYIWPPDHPDRAAWASVNEGLAVDELTVVAPVGGVYQVEAYGYAASGFQIQIDEPAGQAATAGATAANDTPASKTLREQPLIPASVQPGEQQGIAAAPARSDHPLLLPIVSKQKGSSPPSGAGDHSLLLPLMRK